MPAAEILRLAAFTDDPHGGNPAGVVIGAALAAPDEMLRIAAEVGYSETAFLAGDGGSRWTARYFSPAAEVPFCGHATIASAVALYERSGATAVELETAVGTVPVTIETDRGRPLATLTSVEPSVADLAGADLARRELLTRDTRRGRSAAARGRRRTSSTTAVPACDGPSHRRTGACPRRG